jgi:hypothetical protein
MLIWGVCQALMRYNDAGTSKAIVESSGLHVSGMPGTSFVSQDHVKGSYTYKGVLAMSIEHNKALARRVTEEGLNQQNPALVDELCAPNFVFHNASRG